MLWENPAHTATDALGNSDPQLSLLKGEMFTEAKAGILVVELKVTDLSETVPTGASAADWYMTWTHGSTTYFAQAQLGALPTSSPTFSDGTVVVTGTEHQYETAHSDTGSFSDGTNGTVTIDVPLANVGGLSSGAVLDSPTGATYIEEGAPPNPSGESGGILEAVDSGGPTKNYTIGSSCSS